VVISPVIFNKWANRENLYKLDLTRINSYNFIFFIVLIRTFKVKMN
jgi:hypothetical protein